VLHDDEALVALDKPTGLLSIPGRTAEAPSAWKLAETQLGQRLYAVHRLDRETSGVLMLAKSPQTHRLLNEAFEKRRVEKRYRARVFPAPEDDAGRLVSRLTHARRGFMRVAKPGEEGQEAVTLYRLLARFPSGEALLELEPLTGRTHQLRLQLADLGSPIVGEPHYRTIGGPVPLPAERLWLHALSLELGHPLTGERVKYQSLAPEPLRELGT